MKWISFKDQSPKDKDLEYLALSFNRELVFLFYSERSNTWVGMSPEDRISEVEELSYWLVLPRRPKIN